MTKRKMLRWLIVDAKDCSVDVVMKLLQGARLVQYFYQMMCTQQHG